MDIKITIRTKLLFFSFVISALPLLLLLSFISFQIRAQTRRVIHESLQTDLRAARGILEQRGDALQGIANTVADMSAALSVIEPLPVRPSTARGRSVGGPTRGQFYTLLNAVASGWKVDFLVITDEQGRVAFRMNKSENGQGDLSRHALVSQVLAGKPANGLVRETAERLAQEELEVKAGIKRGDKSSGAVAPASMEKSGLCMEAAVPILDSNKKITGVVLAGELLNNNVALVDEIKGTVYGSRLDAGAVSIYLDDYTIATNFYTGEGRALGVISPSAANPKELENWFGQPYVTAYETLKDPKNVDVGKLQVAVKEQWFQQPENQFRVVVFQVTLVAILIFLAVAAWASYRFTRPILDVTDAANRISLGEVDIPVQATTGDEIELLAEAIERMRLSLRAALTRLKKV